MFSRKKLVAAAVVAGALALAGCSSSSPANEASKDGAYSIGLVSFSQANSTSNNILVGFQEVADKKGWKTTLVDAQGAPDKAIAAIQNLVAKKVDAIFYTVFPANAMAAGVLSAKAAGIPVLTAGGGLSGGVQATWDFGYAEGVASAKEVLKDLQSGGNLLALGYDLGGPCGGRDQAMKEATANTDVDVTFQQVTIPGQVQSGQQYAQAWLAAHPANSGPNVIWSCFDEPAQGVIAAVKAAGRTDVTIHGLDGPAVNLRAVQDGSQTSTVWIDATGAGRIAAEAIPEALENGVDGVKTIDKVAPFTVVTKDNIKAFLSQHPEALKD
ncbi:sugar ABC transporter substrate-binding protein [Arthrobacter sp. StoSoilA2]|uniref:sugar ABC transporter substrate-binding protein n=1 Tax=Arthrobacter sp. StoSoilA2 TaxID=2830990 RepID=UPI001CC6765F|nr:sugar ABC transporter substrate-binding protein [Arthrobacter sp. StoSoilA2]BCW35867.1 sugar ABC transporter substrate-binding protein [Arthrobacter sp. StoSoilA2]